LARNLIKSNKQDHHLLAKSNGETLEEHVLSCLMVWQELKSAIPKLPETSGISRFWDLLFAALYVHDIGKGQIEFQKLLRHQPNDWERQRHEIYSIPFVEKFNLNDDEEMLIKEAVLSHHRDFGWLDQHHKDKQTLQLEYHNKWKDKGKPTHPEDYEENLCRKFNKNNLIAHINQFNHVTEQFGIIGLDFSRKVSLKNQKHPIVDIVQKTNTNLNDLNNSFGRILFSGSLKICDHYGSAKQTKFRHLKPSHFVFLDRLKSRLEQEGKNLYSHQVQCQQQKSHCILIAPTGSGKTEAALAWLRNQEPEKGRIYYVLPFTASINAMHQRLAKNMDPEHDLLTSVVGVQHGHLEEYLASFHLKDHSGLDLKTRIRLKKEKEKFKRMIHPIKILTPFQLLKYFYGIKRFEMGFVQLVGAKLIFDEIHAYDAVTFAQILIMLQVLIQRFQCTIMIMTATLPTFLLQMLQRVLCDVQPIKPESPFLDSARHKIHFREGQIFNCISEIDKLYRNGKRILVVCNTVRHAQIFFQRILDEIDINPELAVLLHGRFTANDRAKKEQKALSPQTRILVGTQAIEISLDIDYDILFTEPAPLDALLQRFGRVNRYGLRAPSPVIVFKQGGDYDHYIYPSDLVKRTRLVLEEQIVLVSPNSKSCQLADKDIQILMDKVYPDWLPDQKHEFEMTLTAFSRAVDSLSAYTDFGDREEEFYAKFTGIHVLPAALYHPYEEYLQIGDTLSAGRLLVNIQRGMYFQLRDNGHESQIELKHIDLVNEEQEIERHTVLIAKCRYDHAIGMTNDFEELEENVFM